MSKKKNCSVGDSDKEKEKSRPSAFRAVNSISSVTDIQMVPAGFPVFPVNYRDVIFDLNNEYNPDSSTFKPKKDGVYLIIASITFFPNDSNVNYRLVLNIRVNGIPVITDDEFFGPNTVGTGDQVSVSGILKLKADDEISVSLFSTTNGSIGTVDDPNFPVTPRGTHFEAARFTFK